MPAEALYGKKFQLNSLRGEKRAKDKSLSTFVIGNYCVAGSVWLLPSGAGEYDTAWRYNFY